MVTSADDRRPVRGWQRPARGQERVRL